MEQIVISQQHRPNNQIQWKEIQLIYQHWEWFKIEIIWNDTHYKMQANKFNNKTILIKSWYFWYYFRINPNEDSTLSAN